MFDDMSDPVAHDGAPQGLVVVPLDEAIRLAKPWQWDEPSALEGIGDDEWDAFVAALEAR